MFSTVSMIGLGYIGLPTAALIASRGIRVVGIDINPHAVSEINKGSVHIVEPGLEDLVARVVKEGLLKAYTSPQSADAYIIAVPTPFKENHAPDLSYVMAAGKSIAPLLKKGDLVVLESTSPVGATEELSALLQSCRPDLAFPEDVHMAYCPERILPGHALRELMENDRIIGGLTPACTQKAIALYKTFVKGQCLESDAKTAEMAKLTENAFRDVNIAFANELSLICDSLDIDVWNLIDLANHHPRVNILRPGPGVGGHCIAVDPWFIVSKTPELARLIHTARQVNDSKPHHVIAQIEKACEGKKSPKVAFFGLAFKADIDDLRESPAMEIVDTVAKAHPDWQIAAVEPHIQELPKSLASVKLMPTADALRFCDVAVLLVNHQEFYNITSVELMGKAIIDTQGLWKIPEGEASRTATHVA